LLDYGCFKSNLGRLLDIVIPRNSREFELALTNVKERLEI